MEKVKEKVHELWLDYIYPILGVGIATAIWAVFAVTLFRLLLSYMVSEVNEISASEINNSYFEVLRLGEDTKQTINGSCSSSNMVCYLSDGTKIKVESFKEIIKGQ